MRDVAALAGVSLKTVSRVINGDSRVDPVLAERVRVAGEKLEYRPNRIASDLRRRNGQPSTVGLLIQDVSNEFSASIFRSVEDVAEMHGVTVLASNVDEDPVRERKLAADLVARRVDGLIIVPTGDDQSYLAREQRTGTPMVFVDRPPHFLKADTVVSDNEGGARAGVAHLLAAGHRRVGFLGEPAHHEPAALRYGGYVEALRDAGISVDGALVRRELRSELDANAAVMEFFEAKDPPTALFAAHNRLTIGAIHGLRTLHLERKVGIVGFDDFALADLLLPAVSVVAQDPATLGRTAAELLFRRISRDRSPVGRHVVPTRLIARGSGEIAPGRG